MSHSLGKEKLLFMDIFLDNSIGSKLLLLTPIVFTLYTAHVNIYGCERGLIEDLHVFVVATQLLWGDTLLF